MAEAASVLVATELMRDFGESTGLTSSAPPRRYLWTDAFAVCNFLELCRLTGNNEHLDLALRLVQQVHHILGRHRDDDRRKGWISGAEETEGEKHPTIGGLRIGKDLPEHSVGKADDPLEWDRDGQYFHYLTKWMHALNCLSQATGKATHLRWGLELAKTAHSRFTYSTRLGKRMYWKMSIDLTRPLTSSMGQHDPLDGYVTYCELQAASAALREANFPSLDEEINETSNMCEHIDFYTNDPLGIGGLLFDAWRIALLATKGTFADQALLDRVLETAMVGMNSFAKEGSHVPADYRLPFRELGLSIGLHAIEKLLGLTRSHPSLFSSSIQQLVNGIAEHRPIAYRLEQYWAANRNATNWLEHIDINNVMLATSLAPESFLAC